VLPANADLEVGAPLATATHGHPHELADAGLVEARERRGVEDPLGDVARDDPTLYVVA